MKSRPHTHPCTVCSTKVPCPGTWERNHDGFPEVICSVIHRPGGETEPVHCETHGGEATDDA